ncbi:hypothetical protein B0H14DRAFT_3905451 [Mycena olivaceomarginata]|nr:hypothetical protein B0H14DRAFT_3905451 [Mycena olivaceomarginata]
MSTTSARPPAQAFFEKLFPVALAAGPSSSTPAPHSTSHGAGTITPTDVAGFDFGISIEQPLTETVTWGVVNRNKDKKEDLGIGQVVTIQEGDNIIDEMTFNTPEVESRDSESGPEFEFHTFGGILQPRWTRENVKKTERFSLIEDVYLQFSVFASTSAPLRPVPNADPDGFHDSVLHGALIRQTIGRYFPSASEAGVNPFLTPDELIGADRVLLPGTPDPRPPFCRPPRESLHCGLGLGEILPGELDRSFVVLTVNPALQDYSLY